MAKTAIALPFTALLALPATAWALEIGGKLEPGLALPLTSPQTQRYGVGGEVSLKGYIGLGRYFDAQAGVSFLGLPALSGTKPSTAGTAWSDSLGLRFKRPHDASIDRGGFYAASPWIDADALYVRTGPLDRFGVTVGAGVAFPLDARRRLWLGPFVRYMQIVETSHPAFADGDARTLFVGVAFEFGTSPLPHVALPPPEPLVCPYCPPQPVAPAVAPDRPDRDHDGVADAMDNCPDAAGPVDNGGCPRYKKVIVKPDKLELTEKIHFSFDKADIEPDSIPLLDDVTQALKDNKGIRVQIEGNTDSIGPKEHNQTLSEDRARAVLKYLQDHGIAAERLTYKGFGSTSPTDTNKTSAGRENNRRVAFVIQFKIIDRSAQ